MNRISVNTTTNISSKTTTTLIESAYKTSLKKKYLNKGHSFNSFQKKFENTYYKNLSFNSSDKKTENNEDINNDNESNNKNDNYSIRIHKRISRIPYNIKNDEILKLKFLNNNVKSQKFSKYSSDSIIDKLKKDIDFPNVNILSKRKKSIMSCKRFSYISSDNKNFKQKFIFLNNDNKYVSFGLYYDKDIIDKSKELNDELIENSIDIDNESDEESIINGIHVCFLDLQRAFSIIKENPECISYVKNKKVKFIS